MTSTPQKPLRSGWTTGSCAAAAAKATAIWVTTQQRTPTVEIPLPSGKRAVFDVVWTLDGASVIKDAGDDPDCTDKAQIVVSLEEIFTSEFEFRAGDGVGTVTKPGLGLEVGGPAINPVPRRMIQQAVGEVTEKVFTVIISVPGGQEMATKTTNDRLGILGGISILGTTGIVRPFSTAAYRASVVQQIDVAHAQGVKTIVLATGSRSELLATKLFPNLDPVCFVEVGDFTGIALKKCNGYQFEQVIWIGMVGKITKLATGYTMTHFHRSTLDNTTLATAATSTTTNAKIIHASTATDTARHFYEVCMAEGEIEPLIFLCDSAATTCRTELSSVGNFTLIMSDFDGDSEVCRAR